MGRRRKARELTLQLLYQLDVQGEGDPRPHLDDFWRRHPVDPEAREFAEALVRGTKTHEAEIDELIVRYAENWELERMAVVDRNILRMAVFEMGRYPATPPVVVLDEAIEVGKKYGSEQSGAFVNGILDAIRKRFERERS